ncbi:copper amine oxidase N-terminal domain-containing protein [Paenibacillus harenae]|uniref:copper amine oxidase N-terminal domain-containing protein n=1 Tax=Paenibacillus harenae TaxID=306543 RepID=UPI000423C862|nr:copper amine oxidase N-terminal domain-containing protein [Paenibacillus harenae]
MVRKWGVPSKLAALVLVFALVFLAGCQSISNVDFNKTLMNALKVTSSEGTQSVELKLEMDEKAYEGMPEEEIALIKLVTHIKLQLDQVKVQDNEHVSFNGSLIFGDTTSIAFSLKMSDTLAVMELEGAKQPFALDLTSAGLLGLTGMPPLEDEGGTGLDNASLTALGHQMIDTVGSYVIGNLPNPERIEVKPVNELINGASTSLMHVHIDMNGQEIRAWVKKYVDALAADRAGLDQMIAGVFELLSDNPDVWAAIGAVNPIGEGERRLDAPTLDDTLKEASDEIAAMLANLQDELKLAEEEDPKSLDRMFGENLTVQADVYMDNKLDIRKQVYAFSYVPGEDEEAELLPFKRVTVNFESEAWNVNGDVKAETPVVSDDALKAETLAGMHGYQVLKQFDEESVIYDLLKNKLHIGKQSVSWIAYGYYNPVIITATQRTLIPLRETADEFGAELTYDAKTKSVELYDEATDTTILIKNNSDSAVVNGKTVKWSFPVTVVDGTTYVPARDLASALGAKLKWSEIYEDEKVFTIEREI